MNLYLTVGFYLPEQPTVAGTVICIFDRLFAVIDRQTADRVTVSAKVRQIVIHNARVIDFGNICTLDLHNFAGKFRPVEIVVKHCSCNLQVRIIYAACRHIQVLKVSVHGYMRLDVVDCQAGGSLCTVRKQAVVCNCFVK